MNDRNISDKKWNTYLYSDKFKAFRRFKDEDHACKLRCKFGTIQLYSFEEKELCYVFECDSIRKKSAEKKRLPNYCVITQEGDTDFVCKFPEDKLEDLSLRVKIWHKRRYSPEVLKQMRARGQKLANIRQGRGFKRKVAKFQRGE